MVHIYCYSVGDGGAVGDSCSDCIVTDGVAIVTAEQTPGKVIHSKHRVTRVSPPADAVVTHGYIDLSSPLNFPVTATGQTSATHQLGPAVKSVWVVHI